MQTDGRLIQHIKHAGRPVADGAGKLHALAFAGGECGGRAVEGQVAKPQIHQPSGDILERIADAFCHRLHFRRQAVRHACDPLHQIHQRHAAGFIQRYAAQLWGACRRAQAAAAAVRADIQPEEFLHALHARFVLDLGERVFDRSDGAVIGKIQFACLIGSFGVIKDMLLFRGSIVDDFLFPLC